MQRAENKSEKKNEILVVKWRAHSVPRQPRTNELNLIQVIWHNSHLCLSVQWMAMHEACVTWIIEPFSFFSGTTFGGIKWCDIGYQASLGDWNCLLIQIGEHIPILTSRWAQNKRYFTNVKVPYTVYRMSWWKKETEFLSGANFWKPITPPTHLAAPRR